MTTLRDELLALPKIGPQLAERILAVVEPALARARVPASSSLGSAAIEALRRCTVGVNPPHGCPVCGVEGCTEKCEVWAVTR